MEIKPPNVDIIDTHNALDKVKTDIFSKSPYGPMPVEGEEDIKPKAPSLVPTMNLVKDKSNLIDYSPQNISREDYYVEQKSLFGDKKFLAPRYENYRLNVDNAELQAQEQATSNKWVNGLSKLGLKTGTAVLGGTVGTVTGALNGIKYGSWSAMYTDDFNTWIDDLNEKLDYKLPNYYTAQEKEMNFGESLLTANFWANDLTGGLSFTLGTIVSEGIWAFATGGASLATTGARWGLRAMKAANISKGISKWNGINKTLLRKAVTAKEVDGVIKKARGMEALNTLRFTYTSAGYEAGVEARHFMKEAKENFEYDFEEAYGRKPTQEERNEFDSKVRDAGNSVFAGNMAVVGGSNLAIFGKMFNIKKPSILPKGTLDRKLFGIGTEIGEDGARQVVKATRGQKILSKSYRGVLKPVATEAFWEEGNQSIMGNSANNWISATYDPKLANQTYGIMEALADGFSETYTTKEGWKEVGLGAIIGILGGGMGGSFREDGSRRKSVNEYGEKIDAEYGAKRFIDRLNAVTKIQHATEVESVAESKGDLTGAELARKQALLSQIDFQHEYGMSEEGYLDFKTQLETTPNEELAKELGVSGEGAIDQVKEYKEKLLAEYKNTQETYERNKEFADAVLGQGKIPEELEKTGISKELIAKSVAYNMTMGEGSLDLMNDYLNEIKAGIASIPTNKDGELNLALDVDAALSTASKEQKREFRQAQRRASKAYVNLNKIKRKITAETAKEKSLEDKVATQQRLIELSEELAIAEQEKSDAEAAWELTYNTIKMNNPIGNQDMVTATQLNRLYQKGQDSKGNDVEGGLLNEVFKNIEHLKNTRPKDYQRYVKLYNEYKKSAYAFQQYNKTIQGLTNENFNVRQYATKLGYKMFKGKPVNEFTKEFWVDIGTSIIASESIAQEAMESQVNTSEEINTTKKDKPINPVRQEDRPLTHIERIEEQIKEFLKKNSIIADYIGENPTEAKNNKPTETEVETYKSLLRKVKRSKLGRINLASLLADTETSKGADPKEVKDEYGDDLRLTVEELEQYKELTEKMSKWEVMEGTLEDGTTLADLINRLEQLKTRPQANNVKEEVTEKDAFDIHRAGDKDAAASLNSKEMVQNPTGVYLKVNKKGERVLSHISLESIITRYLPEAGKVSFTASKNGKKKEIKNIEQLRKLEKVEGNTFYIETPQGTIKVEVKEHSRLYISSEDWAKIENTFQVKFITSEIDPQRSSGIVGYQVLENGELIPVASDFKIDTTLQNRPEEMTEEELHKVDKVDLYLDPLNTYNAQLLANYRKAVKSKNEKAIKKAKEKLDSEVVIYMMSGGKIVGQMRGGLENLGQGVKYDNYSEIRENAGTTLIENTSENLVNLKTTIPVSFKYNGSPIFNMKVGEDGKIKLNPLPITKKVVSLSVDAGYVENGKLTLGGKIDSDNVVTAYLPNNSQKTPVVIFKYRGENIAFPVSLQKKSSRVSRQVEDILGTNTLTPGQKVNAINDILIENGIAPADYNISESDLNSREAIDRILDGLDTEYTVANVEEWATKEYNLDNLREDASINIDFENKPFNTPKIKVNLTEAQISSVKPEDRRIELVNELQEFARVIDAGKHSYPNVVNTEFTDILDDRPFKFSDTYIIKEGNVTILEKLSKAKKPKDVLAAYGEDFFKELSKKLSALRTVKERESIIKSTSLKNAVNTKVNENC